MERTDCGKIDIVGPDFISSLFGKDTTMAQHYGMKEKEFDNMVNDMTCDFIKSETKNDVLDKNFKEFNGEQRLKVFAFALAFINHKKMIE